ncbi:hypothetical protein [Aequoribacter sp.]|uniref:hypothetical protein n=1 Tax=Aequoribacter sp. TaxID=2847771 RepID=UPI003C6FBFD7
MPVMQGDTISFPMACLVIETDHKNILLPQHLQTPPDWTVLQLTHTGIEDELR